MLERACLLYTSMNESGLLAVRKKKNSSMSVSVDLVKTGDADAVVSACLLYTSRCV